MRKKYLLLTSLATITTPFIALSASCGKSSKDIEKEIVEANTKINLSSNKLLYNDNLRKMFYDLGGSENYLLANDILEKEAIDFLKEIVLNENDFNYTNDETKLDLPKVKQTMIDKYNRIKQNLYVYSKLDERLYKDLASDENNEAFKKLKSKETYFYDFAKKQVNREINIERDIYITKEDVENNSYEPSYDNSGNMVNTGINLTTQKAANIREALFNETKTKFKTKISSGEKLTLEDIKELLNAYNLYEQRNLADSKNTFINESDNSHHNPYYTTYNTDFSYFKEVDNKLVQNNIYNNHFANSKMLLSYDKAKQSVNNRSLRVSYHLNDVITKGQATEMVSTLDGIYLLSASHVFTKVLGNDNQIDKGRDFEITIPNTIKDTTKTFNFTKEDLYVVKNDVINDQILIKVSLDRYNQKEKLAILSLLRGTYNPIKISNTYSEEEYTKSDGTKVKYLLENPSGAYASPFLTNVLFNNHLIKRYTKNDVNSILSSYHTSLQNNILNERGKTIDINSFKVIYTPNKKFLDKTNIDATLSYNLTIPTLGILNENLEGYYLYTYNPEGNISQIVASNTFVNTNMLFSSINDSEGKVIKLFKANSIGGNSGAGLLKVAYELENKIENTLSLENSTNTNQNNYTKASNLEKKDDIAYDEISYILIGALVNSPQGDEKREDIYGVNVAFSYAYPISKEIQN